jgi:phosphopantothenoylcysteine decarboxylase/phosphopantothenate--cysteine ligase
LTVKKEKKTVILGVTGSIAAYRACDMIGLIRRCGIDVHVLLTVDGARFITPLTLQTLSGNKVITDMFETPSQWQPLHTSFADMADAVLIAPATAAIIGKLAAGICDDILSCVVFATKAPVLIAPAMNGNMYRNPMVRGNIARLKKAGYRFVGPVKGRLACGSEDMGHIASSADIIDELKRILR